MNKVVPTKRQREAAKKMAEGGRTQGEILREVGYSKVTSESPTKVTRSKGFKEATKPLTKQIEKEINRAMKHLPKVVHKAGWGEAVGGIEKLSKLNELLGGRPTEIVNDLSNLSSNELRARIKKLRDRRVEEGAVE